MIRAALCAFLLSVGTLCAQNNFEPAPYHKLNGIPGFGMNRLSGSIASDANLREKIHTFMRAAALADKLYRLYEKKRLTAEAVRQHADMQQLKAHLKAFTDLLSQSGHAGGAKMLVRAIIEKHRSLDMPGGRMLMPDLISHDMNRANKSFAEIFNDNAKTIAILDQIRAARDVMLDNLTKPAHTAYVKQYGDDLIKSRFIDVFGPPINYVQGWSNRQMLLAALLSMTIGSGLTYGIGRLRK